MIIWVSETLAPRMAFFAALVPQIRVQYPDGSMLWFRATTKNISRVLMTGLNAFIPLASHIQRPRLDHDFFCKCVKMYRVWNAEHKKETEF